MMKRKHIRLKFNYTFLLLIITIMGLKANSYSHNQTLVKRYKVNPETVVYLNNKYGKIHVSNWQKDSVRLEINLTIRSSSYTRVYKLKENIDFDFVETKYNITASTIFGSRYNSIFADLIDIAETIVTSDNQVTIDYYMQAPIWLNINIENKYGDVFMDDASGDVTINLSSGKLKANKMLGKTFITVNSGAADIYKMSDGNLTINYSDLKIRAADKLNVTTKGVTGNLDEINYLKLDTKRDKYYISNVSKILGDAYFSDLNISELKSEISLDMKYGSIAIDQIAKDFSLINLTSEYTDMDLVFDRGMAYNFDMTHFNEITFYYPKEISSLQEKLVNEETKEYFVFGTIGQLQTSKSKVNLKAFKKCYIRIEHK